MPNRIVRESIISSQRVNALSAGAELLLRRLMSVVDDYGRYHASPITVRGACWPTCPEKVTENEVAAWLAELVSGGLISIYEVARARYLQIGNFRQPIRSKSKFPDPETDVPADCSQTESDLHADRNQNERAIRMRSSYSECDIRRSDDVRNSDYPVGADDVALAIDCLSEYPLAKHLPGKPDAEIARQCLTAAGGIEPLKYHLRAMFQAHAGPDKSWAYFPAVLRQRCGRAA